MIRLAPSYAELSARSNFSLLAGASHPEEMVARAVELELAGLGLADRNSVAGVVRAHAFLRERRGKADGFRFAPGARLVFSDATPDVFAYPETRKGWGRLTRLLTLGARRGQNGACDVRIDDLIAHGEDIRIIVAQAASDRALTKTALREATRALVETFRGRVWIAAAPFGGEDPRETLAARARLARELRAPLIALNEALYHVAERRPLADLLACIRQGLTLKAAGAALASAHAGRHLKDAEAMAALFVDHPDALDETLRFLRGLSFSLDELGGRPPEVLRHGHATPQAALAALAEEGARQHDGSDGREPMARRLAEDLALVARRGGAPQFLLAQDITRIARAHALPIQNIGAAAQSALGVRLGLAGADPAAALDPDAPPDIGVAFAPERRDELIALLHARYGRDHTGWAASVVAYDGRDALRDVGAVFGLSPERREALSRVPWDGSGDTPPAQALRDLGFDPDEPALRQALALAGELRGVPRAPAQRSSVFVVTQDRLDEAAPVCGEEGEACLAWDEDDLAALGVLAIELALRALLSTLGRGFDLIQRAHGKRWTLDASPRDDASVDAMIAKGDTLGVFDSEDLSETSRLKPKNFGDLVIAMAMRQPSPIREDMAQAYLRRREGVEDVVYPHEELRDVLARTLGTPLFQDQALQIAIVAAGLTPAEADRLRRIGAPSRRVGATLRALRDKMVEGMVAKGYDRAFALRCVALVAEFGAFGLSEEQATACAALVYAACWMKLRRPDAFYAATLNAPPEGVTPAQLLRDARAHGVDIRAADVNRSDWDATLEPCDAPHPRVAGREADDIGRAAVRLGLRAIEGLRWDEMRQLAARRGRGYDSARDLWLRGGLSPDAVETLAQAGALASLGLSRREALSAARRLGRAHDRVDLPLLPAATDDGEPDADLSPLPPGAETTQDHRALSSSLTAHPVAYLRARLMRRGAMACAALATASTSERAPRVAVAGLVVARRRPAAAGGAVLIAVEDETGGADIFVAPKIFERMRAAALGARLVAATGRLRRDAGVVRLVAEKIEDWSAMLAELAEAGPGLLALSPDDPGGRAANAPPRAAPADRQLRLDGLAPPPAPEAPAAAAPKRRKRR